MPAWVSVFRAVCSFWLTTLGMGIVPLETLRVNVLSGAACEPGLGWTAVTFPAGCSESTSVVLTVPVNPADLIKAVACWTVRPTRSVGTGSVFGPAPITRPTEVFLSTWAPLAGVVLSTLPF